MSQVGIDILNDDCLLQILELLPLKKRLNVELVSKRWQILCHQLWKFTQTLVVGTNAPEYYSFHYRNNNKIQLEPLLKLCGTNLKFLTIGYDVDCGNNNVLELVAKYCDSLQSLTLSDCKITGPGVENFCIKLNFLTEIKLYSVNITDKQLEHIFISQPKLKCLELERIDTLNEPNFDKLNKEVESISIMCCTNIENYYIIRHLNKFKYLKKINIDTGETLNVNELVRVIPQQIKHLAITCHLLNNEVLHKIGVLKNLRSLYLDLSKAITDNTIADIVENCRLLESIQFYLYVNDSPLTSEGLKRLSELQELTKINMEMMDQINDEVLEMWSSNEKITQLNISVCRNVTDRGVMAVLQQCTHLQQLDIQCCNITQATLVKAVEVAKTRPLTPHLRIYIGRWNEDLEIDKSLYQNTCLKIINDSYIV